MAATTPRADLRLGTTVVLVRAFLLAAVVLSCAAFSHVLADGLLPSTTGMVVLLLGSTLVARRFLRRPAGRWSLLALVVGGQALLHVFMSAMAGHVGDPVRAATATTPVTPVLREGTTLHEQYAARQDALAAASNQGALDPALLIAHQWEHLTDTGPLMVLTHTGAAVVVALWLASGERALATLLALSADRVAAAAPALVRPLLVPATAGRIAPAQPPATSRRTASCQVIRPHRALEHRVVSHRGPPGLRATPVHLPAR